MNLRRLNRPQALALVVLAIAWIAGLVSSADLYRNVAFGFLGGIVYQLAMTAVIAFLAIGVLKRWRWTFYLLMVFFLLQGISPLVAVSNARLLQELGASDPGFANYMEGQIRTQIIVAVGLSLPAFLTGLAMVIGLRRSGVWGAF